MKASELNLINTNMLLWGPPRTGKTVFAGTLGEKLQLIDLDNNAGSLATFKDKFYEERRKVDVVCGMQNETMNEHGALQQWALVNLKAYLLSVHGAIKQGKYPYKALCIDSLTTLIEMGTRKILVTHRDKNQLHPNTLSQGQYQFMFNEVYDVLQLFVALPLLSILIAHEETNTLDNVQTHEILIPGKNFPSLLRKNFPEITYCRVQGGQPAGTPSRFTIQTIRSWDATAGSGLQLVNGSDMSEGLPAILQKAGVSI